MPDNSINNTKLRICVPGIVNNIRRDYDNLFRILLANAEKLNDAANKIERPTFTGRLDIFAPTKAQAAPANAAAIGISGN